MSNKSADVKTTAFDAPVVPEVRIPFGAGYDHPTFVARGNVAQIKSQIKSFFGLKSTANTGAEAAIEAALYVHGLVQAATLGATPQPDSGEEGDSEQTNTEPATTARKSIAQKKRSDQPEDNTDSVEALVEGATSKKGLRDIYKKFEGQLTEEQLALFSAKKAELEEQEKGQ